MAELALTRDLTLELRARAHSLEPVVLLGTAGLSEAVFREIDRALGIHGLIKVRAGKGGEREEREAQFRSMAARLGAARVQAIGHVLVLYRPVLENDSQAARGAKAAKVARKKPAARPQRPARPEPPVRPRRQR